MIGELAFMALATTTAAAPAMKRKEESLVIVRKEQSASIEQITQHSICGLFAGTVTTYQSEPPSLGNDNVPFISPITCSFTVKAKLRVGGEVVQPPIDFDDIVYFDE